MKKANNNFYISGKYIEKNPTIHEEDNAWKTKKILPFVDIAMKRLLGKNEINILDVGGGTGLIIKNIGLCVNKIHRFKINKFCLDVSPDMLRIQKINNPEAVKFLCEDIKQTSLSAKQMDLALVIDVLEHVLEPEKALRELRRISDFAIFKVPLEDNLILKILNFVTRGRFKQEKTLDTLGHINTYNIDSLTKSIAKDYGQIIKYSYTNAYEYFLYSPDYTVRNTFVHKVVYYIAMMLYKLSPVLAAKVFNDFVIILAKAKD